MLAHTESILRQIGQDLHVRLEAGRTTGKVQTDRRIGVQGMFDQVRQVGMGKAVDSLGIGDVLELLYFLEASGKR